MHAIQCCNRNLENALPDQTADCSTILLIIVMEKLLNYEVSINRLHPRRSFIVLKYITFGLRIFN